MPPSIRHMRMFLTLAETRSLTRTAALCHVSQPAVTQAMNKIERDAGQALFARGPLGAVPTPAGRALALRMGRALDLLDRAGADLAPALRLQATWPQLLALIAATGAANFTQAARGMGLAQPTLHRAISQLERAAGARLFGRSSHGVIASRTARQLAQAARLALAEMDQAEAELAALAGRAGGMLRIGLPPLSTAAPVVAALRCFHTRQPGFSLNLQGGPAGDLHRALRRAATDLLFGPLDPSPDPRLRQEGLYEDRLVILAGPGHPLLTRTVLGPKDLAGYPLLLLETPLDEGLRRALPAGLATVTAENPLMLRDLLKDGAHLALLPRGQVAGLADLRVLPLDLPDSTLTMGITTRTGWQPTPQQAEFIGLLRDEAAKTWATV